MDNNNQQQQRQPTTTTVRQFYSEGVSYMSTQFFNTNFSINLVAFLSKDNLGKSTYDKQNGVGTTLNYESVFTLFESLHNIHNGKDEAKGCVVNIPCTGGATMVLERKAGAAGPMETWLAITKNGKTIPFKFATITKKVMENGVMVERISESGVGAFGMTLHGYLTGINDGRHLDKLTEDYVKSLGPNAQQQGGDGFQTNSGYQPRQNNNWRNNNNRGGGYRKPYNPNYNNQGQTNYNPQPYTPPQQQQPANPPTQNMSDYNLPT